MDNETAQAELTSLLASLSTQERGTLLTSMHRLVQQPLPAAPVLPAPGTPLEAYRLWLKDAVARGLSATDQEASFLEFLAATVDAGHRADYARIRMYHHELRAAFKSAAAAQACILEPSLDHSTFSTTTVELLNWLQVYKQAFPNTKAPSVTGGSKSKRRGHRKKAGAPAAAAAPAAAPAATPQSRRGGA